MKTRVPCRRAARFPGVEFAAIVLVAGFSVRYLEAQQAAPPVQCGFEEPDFTLGNIHGQRGWAVEQGKAEVVEDQAHSGKRALKLFPADPFSQAKLSLAPGVPPAPVMFLDFYVIPAASDAVKQEEFLDIDGARIGLFSDPVKPGEGIVHVFHGDGAGGGAWMATAVKLALQEGGNRASGWVRLSLREDFSRQSWDLLVDGKPAAADVGFQVADVGHAQNYIIMGDAMESVMLDDLSIQKLNQQGPDADSDGILDSIERRLGLNLLFDDRDGDADGDGVRNLEEALAAMAGEGEGAGLVNASPERPSPPGISLLSGFLEAPSEVALSGLPAGGKILYTTDGSDPRRGGGSRQYERAISVSLTMVLRASAVDVRGRMSEPVTAAWVFAQDVVLQSQPAGTPSSFHDVPRGGGAPVDFPVSWGLTAGDGAGLVPSASIAPALMSAPVVVIGASPSALFDPESGMYAKSSQKIIAAASLLYFADGRAAVPAEVVVSISGESSRYHDVSPKHSLRLRFAGPEAAGDILTGGTGQGALRQAVLRHPTHDSWTIGSHWANTRRNAKYFADGFAARWMGDAGHLTLRRQWVHVFLNASYWGVYEAIEQNEPEPNGITDLLEGGPGQQADAIFGDAREWRETRQRLNILASDAANGPVDDAEWNAVIADFDVTSLIDYILLNCWMTNLDWPEHNYLIAKSGGFWRFLSWDAEWAMRKDDGVAVDMSQRLQSAGDGPAFAFSRLCWWPAFRTRVGARLAELTLSGGLLHPDSLALRIGTEAGAFGRIMSAEAARWGALMPEPGAVAQWQTHLKWLTEKYVPERTGILARHFHAMLTQIGERAAEGALAAKSRSSSSMEPVLAPFRPAVVRPDYGGDRDGDGIPDDWELTHGLNPKDGTDGLADSDGDGLNNLAEYLLGRDSGRAESAEGVFAVEPSGVHTRMQLPKIRNGQRVTIFGRVLTTEEAQRAAAEEAQAASTGQ